jgi:manganese-dependent ADP-ribose/CDP-alcohol diphosphatase
MVRASAQRRNGPDPFSAADASSSDSDDDESSATTTSPRPRLPPTPQPHLHRHASHIHRGPPPPNAADGTGAAQLPPLPERGEDAERVFGPHICKLGVISDVQHAAGIPDGKSFHGVPRYYAAALEGARRAGRAFAAEQGLRYVLHLGDTIDGQHAVRGSGSSERAFNSVVDALLGVERGEEAADAAAGSAAAGAAGAPAGRYQQQERILLNLTANHEFYNFGGDDRATLNALLGITPPQGPEHDGASYYSVQLAPGWRALGLDSYDVSMLGRPAGDPRHAQAVATLRAHNPNGSDDRPQGWDSPEGLHGVARRHVRFGGGASARQVAWLRSELAQARRLGERVLVLNHLPLHPATAPPPCLLWNYREVLDVLAEFPGTVAATLAGHAHMNGYVFEGGAGAAAGGSGVHHLVLPCVLETPPDRDCWAVMDVHERGLVLRGVDTCMSLAMALGAAPVVRAAGEAEAEAEAEQVVGALARVAISSSEARRK